MQKRGRVGRIEAEGQSLSAVRGSGTERERDLGPTDRSVRLERIQARRVDRAAVAARLKGQRGRRQRGGAVGQRPAPSARSQARHQQSEFSQPIGAQAPSRHDPFGPDRALGVEGGAAKVRHAQAVERNVGTAFGRLQDHGAAVDRRFADVGDVHRIGLQRERQIEIANERCACLEVRQRLDVERIARKIHVQAAGIGSDRTGDGERTRHGRPIEPDLEIATGKPDRGRFDVARQGRAAIGQRLAESGGFGGEVRRAEARPIAQERDIAAVEINRAAELGRRARFQIAFAPKPAAPGEAEIEPRMQRRAGAGAHCRRGLGERLRAQDNAFSREIGVDRHRPRRPLERRLDGAGKKRHGADRRDAVLALAAQQRVDIGLLGPQREAESGGRAICQRRRPMRRERPFVRSEPKLDLLDRRPVEIGGHAPDRPPGRQPFVASDGADQRGGTHEAEIPCAGRRGGLERAVEFERRPILAGVDREPNRRFRRTRLFRGEVKDDRRAVRPRELARDLVRSVQGRGGRIELNAGDLPDLSAGPRNDPRPPIADDEAVESDRFRSSRRRRGQTQRAVGGARNCQNRLYELNIRESDRPARQLDERELQAGRGEG